jgi:PAS domain S-box-containing protein
MYRHRLLDIIPVARDKLIENLQDAIVVLDAQNRILDANPAAETILGRRLEDIVGKPSAEAGAVFANLAQQHLQVSEGASKSLLAMANQGGISICA